jgi:phosphate transport system substrate-binding protein
VIEVLPHRTTCSIFLALAVSACSGRPEAGEADERESALTIRGSDTMVILAQRWAEAFMERHPDVAVQVSGGGSGTGVAALINGTTDLATVSRPLHASERALILERRRAEAVETAVALDAVAVYVHADNPIEALDLPELHAVFRGRLERWRDVGGSDDRPIVLYGRENNSGTYAYFKERVLDGEDFAAETQTLPGTAAVIHAVALDRNAIGYGGIAYAEGVRAVPIAALSGGPPYEPAIENAENGLYPLARYLHLCSAGAPEGVARELVDFALSPEGQALVEGVGYYPLPAVAP